VRAWITGHVETKDRVAVIGADVAPVREFSLQITPFADDDELRERWSQLSRMAVSAVQAEEESPEQSRLSEYLRRVDEHFSARPPTLSIGFNERDRDIGTKDEWYLECTIPRAIFEELSADIAVGRCRSVRMPLAIEPPLTDNEYAPPSVGATFGLLRRSRYDTGSAHGWVQGVYWDLKPRRPKRVVVPMPAVSKPEERPRTPSTGVEDKQLSALKDEMENLGARVSRGFVVVIAALVLFAFLG
jgi:hypothetical protein